MAEGTLAEGTLASGALAAKSPQTDLDTFAENDPVRSEALRRWA